MEKPCIVECEVGGTWCVGRIEIVGLGSEGVDLEGVECLGGLETPFWSVDTVTVASSPTLHCASHSSWHAHIIYIFHLAVQIGTFNTV